MITLLPDQDEVRGKLRVALRQHQSVLTFAPTGFGKTVLAAALMKSITEAGKRVIFGVHRDALIKQTANTLDAFGMQYSHIAAGMHYNMYRMAQIASIPTLQNRLGLFPSDYLFIDEAHLSASSGWSKTVEHYKSMGTKIIGLSGSPQRLDGKPLGAIWDTMVLGPSTRQLIEWGRLSQYRAFAPATVDLTGVHSRGGDYVQSEIDDLMSGKAVLAGAVKHWLSLAKGKRTIAFAPSIARAEQLAAEFKASGINAVSLDGGTAKGERQTAFRQFADREIEVLVNVRLFTEGFDLAAQVGRDVMIECVLDYAPTQSLALHLQKHGRGLRRDDDAHFLLDLVGGFSRLGLPDDEREWTLDGEVKTKKKQDGEAVRICPACFAAYTPAPACPVCGLIHTPQGRKVEEVEADLVEITRDQMIKQRNEEQYRSETLGDLIKLATARGYKSPEKWAAHVWTGREVKKKERKKA